MEDDHYGKNISGLLENTKHVKERSKREGTNDSHKSRSAVERKYSDRYKENSTFNDNILFFVFMKHVYI